MKAIIMAGGEGSRLRPLTCDIPKPMARLCGKPVMEYILDLLGQHGITEAAVTIRYLPDAISGHFPDNRYGDIALEFAEEDKPLGTAGSVKNACGDADEVLVISGDAMCDFDLTEAMRFHRDTRADVTIIGKPVEDPREYGLIDIHDDGRIAAFIEKPAFSQAISDLANTGIYILSRGALDLIPDDTFFDFAKDLFPMMLGDGKKLMCKVDTGYWCDIGDLDTYIRCQRDMLAGKVECRIPGRRDAQGNILAGDPPPRTCTIVPPCYIGRDVVIEDGAVIDNSVVDTGCSIGLQSRVTDSILLQGAYVGERARLTGALACAGAGLKQGAMLFEGATAGAGSIIGRRAVVNAGVKIWNGKKVPDSALVTEHLKISLSERGTFGENGITGEIGVELTPEFLARLGSAVGSVKPNARIAVGSTMGKGVRVLKDALAAGIQSAGASVMDFGENFRARFEYDMAFSAAPLGVFITGGDKAGIRVLGPGGLPANRETERSIEAILARGEFVRCPYDRMGDRVEMSGMEMLYKSQLIRYAVKGLAGCAARVQSRSMMVQDTLRDVLYKLGCDVGDGFVLDISSQGDRVRLFDEEYGHIAHHRILAWCAISRMERGEDIALPFDAPHILNGIAWEHDVALHRYYDCPADSSDEEARKIAAFQMWSRDGLMQAVMLLSIIRDAGGLGNLVERHRAFDIATRTVETDGNPAGLIRKINTAREGIVREGVVLTRDNGVVLVKPLKRGRGIKIMAEAASSETAEELAADVERLLLEEQSKRL
ncbi:NTP transferase domain-containing protein [Ruminococcaceae bacterium OttesenSCG-928-L11]|nr:NTP transferase domain-containing protein [Ruminococcaceae bacterium OttesenSCG-928-L11]